MSRHRQRHQYSHPTPAPQQSQQQYTVHHDYDGPASVQATLTHALSDVTGRNVTDIESTLDDRVDLEALDTVFAPMGTGSHPVNAHLSFTVEGFRTTLYGNGMISIVPMAGYQGR